MTDSTNATVHDWLKPQLTTILADCPLEMPVAAEIAINRLTWERWQ